MYKLDLCVPGREREMHELRTGPPVTPPPRLLLAFRALAEITPAYSPPCLDCIASECEAGSS
jgi:hypothetical protein